MATKTRDLQLNVWTHPTTGETRIYLEHADIPRGVKIYLTAAGMVENAWRVSVSTEYRTNKDQYVTLAYDQLKLLLGEDRVSGIGWQELLNTAQAGPPAATATPDATRGPAGPATFTKHGGEWVVRVPGTPGDGETVTVFKKGGASQAVVITGILTTKDGYSLCTFRDDARPSSGDGPRRRGRPAGRVCDECGRPGRLVHDLEDGGMKHYDCCDIPAH